MNENFNFNPDAMNQIKNMVDNGNISDAISQISPEMIQNFSKMLNNNSSEKSHESNNSNSQSEPNSNTGRI